MNPTLTPPLPSLSVHPSTHECRGGAHLRTWKLSGLSLTLNATVTKVDNLVWLPRTRKNENWWRGPTVDKFCAGTCAYRPCLYGDPGPTKVLQGPTVRGRQRTYIFRTCSDPVLLISGSGGQIQVFMIKVWYLMVKVGLHKGFPLMYCTRGGSRSLILKIRP